MSKVSGVLLIVAGLGVSAYVLLTRAEWVQNPPRQLIDSAKLEPASPTRVAVATEPEPAVSSTRAATGPESRPASASVTPESKPATSPPAAAPSRSQPWPPFVTNVHRESAPARLPLPPPQRSIGVSSDRVTLARDLQRELRRVGCYDGEINGVWTTSTRRAMKAFTDRVNAMLPLEEPDYVLLALVRNHPDNACDKPCPAGQGLSEGGRCLPSAFLARPTTKGSTRLTSGAAPKGKAPEAPPPAIVGWTANATSAASSVRAEPDPEGRMSLAGPRPDGSPLAPAVPMSNAGVSLLPDPRITGEVSLQYGSVPPPAAGVNEPTSAPRQADGSARRSWSRSFWKHRDSIF